MAMEGNIKFVAYLMLRFLFIIFFLGLSTPQHLRTCGGEHVPPSGRGRTPFVCTTLAAAIVLCIVHRAADGGGRLLRGLLLLGVALFVASSFLLFEPHLRLADYIVYYQLGCTAWAYVPLAAAAVWSMAIGAGLHVLVVEAALFDRD